MTQSETIRQSIDLPDYLTRFVQLKRNKCKCPFHNDSTPSFSVHSVKKIWKCFGCQVGGDVIKFRALWHQISYAEAQRLFAEELGLVPVNSTGRGVIIDFSRVDKMEAIDDDLRDIQETKGLLTEYGKVAREILLQCRQRLHLQACRSDWSAGDYLKDELVDEDFDELDRFMRQAKAAISAKEAMLYEQRLSNSKSI